MSKRQLGILLVIIGMFGGIGLLALDLIFSGRETGIGPAQRLAIIGMGALVLIGLSLIPLGDSSA